jgi:hypothetical protein
MIPKHETLLSFGIGSSTFLNLNLYVRIIPQGSSSHVPKYSPLWGSLTKNYKISTMVFTIIFKLYFFKISYSHMMSQPYVEEGVTMRLTLPKWGLASFGGLLKFQSSIAGVKTPCIGMFFILLESYRSIDVENGLAGAIWTFIAQVMAKKKGWESNWQFDSWPPKVKN